MTEQRDPMNAREAANYLPLSYVTFQKLRDQGEIVPTEMRDGNQFYSRSYLDQLAEKWNLRENID